MTKRFTQKDLHCLEDRGINYNVYSPNMQCDKVSSKILVKPMSVNTAYTGRRFKTAKYREYCKDVRSKLLNVTLKPGKYHVSYEFGISERSDGDNPVKPFQDILSEKFGFNDKNIMEWSIKKVVVSKGEEYIRYSIELIQP